MRILFIGDIVGKAGRQAIEGLLENVIADHQIEFTVANGENAAGGMGITPVIAFEILDLGVDVLTSGNHIWAKKEIIPFLGRGRRLLRPANYPAQGPGKGTGIFQLRNGQRGWGPESRRKGLYENTWNVPSVWEKKRSKS